jgi:NADPH:quinone reductase
MMKAIVIEKHGGPQVLELQTIATPPQQEKVIVKVGYAGLNFIDIYHREGRYPGIKLPLILGIEAAGTVDYAPPGSGLSVGERVMFASAAQGAYAEYVAVPTESLLRVPTGITLAKAAAALEHGLTADMLVHSVANIEQRTTAHDATALVHAGAGGVGRWLVRMLIDRGVRVIAVVSSAEKAIVVQQLGAIAVLQDGSNWQTAALDKSSGVRPRWIFDSVGADTFEQSMDLLATRGHLILFGAASGPVPTASIAKIMAKSATLTRPVLPHFLQTAAESQMRANRVFQKIQSDPTWLPPVHTFELSQARAAHDLLASRHRVGKVVFRVFGEDNII